MSSRESLAKSAASVDEKHARESMEKDGKAAVDVHVAAVSSQADTGAALVAGLDGADMDPAQD